MHLNVPGYEGLDLLTILTFLEDYQVLTQYYPAPNELKKAPK